MGRGLIARFAVGALVGVVAAVALGLLLRPKIPSSAGTGTPVTVSATDGAQFQFNLVKTNPQPLAPLPDLEPIQPATFHGAGATTGPDGLPTVPWWNDSVPRIDHITQFDGGPLQSVNCLMAAGAMLARLGYGVVTTGSQMRALSGDTADGTSYQNVQDALQRGWDIRVFEGAITPIQLRALLWAGAGAIIHGVYGKLPQNIKVQPSFNGRHAMYVDAFRPAGPNNNPEAAYWVMDPIGKPWDGYKGAWWPADAVEDMIVELPGGRLGAMWAFPGGKAPTNRPQLPPGGYPSLDPGVTPDPSQPVDPFPVDPLPLPPGTDEDGEETGVDPETDGGAVVTEGGGTVNPGWTDCIIERKGLCPAGIVGIISVDGLGPPPTRPPIDFDILYGGALGPGMYEIIYEPPPDTSQTDLFFFGPDGIIHEAKVEAGTLDGKTVAIGTIILDPSINYQFVATAQGDGVRSVSSVGAVEVKQ